MLIVTQLCNTELSQLKSLQTARQCLAVVVGSVVFRLNDIATLPSASEPLALVHEAEEESKKILPVLYLAHVSICDKHDF